MQTLLGINRTYLCSKISSVFLSISKSPHYLKIPISIFTINCRSTMAASPVALILGAGPRIGASVTEKFTSNGYQVAVASRSGTGTKTAEGVLSQTSPSPTQSQRSSMQSRPSSAPFPVLSFTTQRHSQTLPTRTLFFRSRPKMLRWI